MLLELNQDDFIYDMMPTYPITYGPYWHRTNKTDNPIDHLTARSGIIAFKCHEMTHILAHMNDVMM